jgi:hypothetical protein
METGLSGRLVAFPFSLKTHLPSCKRRKQMTQIQGKKNRVIKPRKNRVPVNFLDNCFRVGMLAGKSEVENRSTKWRK